MRKLLIILVVGIITFGVNFAYALETLDVPVTLAAEGKALDDVLAALTKQTGAKLQASREIADQKATIFVNDKSLEEVMQAISTLFGYEWKQKGSGENLTYILTDSKHLQAEREKRHREAAAKTWQGIFDLIARKAELSTKGTSESSTLSKQPESDPVEDSVEAARELVALVEVLDSPVQGLLAKVFSRIPSNYRWMLQQGANIRLDSQSPDPEWLIPADLAQQINTASNGGLIMEGNRRGASGTKPIRVIIEFYSTVDSNKITLWAQISRGGEELKQQPDLPGEYLAGYLMPSVHYKLAEQNMDYYIDYNDEPLPDEHMDIFSEPSPNDLLGDMIQRKVMLRPDELPLGKKTEQLSESPPALNRSEVLAVLYAKLGIQIVADHCSEWYDAIDINGSSLEAIRDNCLENHMDANCGWDGKFFYSRSKETYLAYAAEAPNRLLSKWQRAYKKNGALGIDEFADIAAKTTSEQADRMSRNWDHLNLGSSKVLL